MRILAFIGALAIVIGILAGGYFLGGFYNVAASASDAGPVVWALTRVRTASIARHAGGQPPFALDDAAVLRDGARHFDPEAADLSEVAKTRDASAIFWVLKNGIRMTGMPSFGKAGIPDNELWQIVAFVKKFPSVSESDYKSWSASSQ